MSIVTSSMNSAPNSLFQEQLGVDLALPGGELGPISCPYLLLLPQTPFWPHNIRYHHHLSFISGKPRSPLLMSIFGFSFTIDLLSPCTHCRSPPPRGRRVGPPPMPHKLNRRLLSRSGWWREGGGGGVTFTGVPRRGESSGGVPPLVPGWLRPGRPFPLYSIMILNLKVFRYNDLKS